MTASPASCDFCGLPLSPGWGLPESADGAVAVPPRDSPAEYCCVGCRIAATVTRERGATGAARWMLVRLGLSLFLTLNVLAFSMALWTRDVYADGAAPALAGPLESLLRYLCLLFSLPVLYLLGLPLAENAWQALRRGSLSTDFLLVCGVAAAYAYSAVSVMRDAGPIYFEVGCVILVMVTLGRWFEATGKLQAGAALDELQKLLPEQVRLSLGNDERLVSINEVQIGDRLRILPGERFPTDGRLLTSALHADEQLITGESRPVLKHPGDRLSGGTLNLDADCLLEATAPPNAGTLARLIALVREARQTRGHYQRLADRLSAGVFPVMAVVAIAAGSWHAWRGGLDHGLLVALSVVLVTCPCALGLATPLAVWSALGLAARRQVLFRNGEAFERLATIRAIRFDKTGTLTTGRARVAEFVCDPDTAPEVAVGRAAALARSSSHPFSTAIAQFAETNAPLTVPGQLSPGDVHQIAGRGMVGNRKSGPETSWFLGNSRWMEESGLVWPLELARAVQDSAASGNALSLVGWEGRVRGLFVFSEELRPKALEALAWCRNDGLDVAVLTGDHHERGRALAEQFNVPVLAELTPDDKVAAIRAVRIGIGPVAMVGDGINDAPALAASDVGIALGCGADVSRDSAAVCLLGDDPERLTWAIEFSRRGVRAIRRNLIWAFGYNSVGVVLAATGCLNPAVAALLMVVSSLLVIGHALRLGHDTAGEAEERGSGIADREECLSLSTGLDRPLANPDGMSPKAAVAVAGGFPS